MLAVLAVGISGTSQAATLLGKWNFNEGSGNTGLDSSGNGNNASLVAGPSYVSTGASNYGVQLAAASQQYIDYGTSPLFDLTGPLTLESWFTLLTTPEKTGEMLIFGKDHTLFGTTMWGGTSYSYLGSGSVNVPAPLTIGHAYHLVNTWDGTTLSVYLDGSLAGSTSTGPAPNPNQTNSLLSGKPGPSDGSGYLDAILDEARIYSGALTAGEVAASYAAGPEVVPEPVSIGSVAFASLLLCGRRRK
jgi:hypothetical protein